MKTRNLLLILAALLVMVTACEDSEQDCCDNDPAGNIALHSLGATAFDNGAYNHPSGGRLGAERAIDNDEVSYWAGLENNSPQQMWIEFDKSYSVNRIVITEHDNAYINTGKVEYYNGSSWLELFSIDKSSANTIREFSSVTASGVRLTINTLTAPGSWTNKVACIHSLEVHTAGD